MADTPGLGVLGSALLLGQRREPGQYVQVGDDPAQHPQNAGAIECDVLRLQVGLGAEVHDGALTTLQELQSLKALTEGGHLGREPGLEVGLALGEDRILAPPLAEPSGDLPCFLRAERCLYTTLNILISKEFGRVETSDEPRSPIAARLVFSAGPGVSRIHDGESCRLIEVVRKDVGR